MSWDGKGKASFSGICDHGRKDVYTDFRVQGDVYSWVRDNNKHLLGLGEFGKLEVLA